MDNNTVSNPISAEEIIDLCKGCYTRIVRISRRLNPQCTPAASRGGRLCPCLKCIIKPMCRNECQDFTDFRQRARKDWY